MSPTPPSFAGGLWRRARGWAKWARHRTIELFASFGNDDLLALLRRLGIREGDVVLAHVAFNQFLGFQGGPGDVIVVLQKAVGPSGTLLMPTLPFGGTAVDWARAHPLTDLKRTPSAMGLVTEMFRRSPGVIRSPHPTHPVAAWGARAEELTRDHHRAETPCGKLSPYLKLLDVDGKILLLGADIDSMTFYHGVEEVLEPRLPTSPFTSEWFELQTRDAAGVTRTTRTRLFDPELSRRRDMSILTPHLRRAGVWHEGRVGRLPVRLVRAADVLKVCEDLAGRGVYCYGA